MTIKAINVRNQFKGVIKEILIGEVVSEIDVQTASGIVTSVITTRSLRPWTRFPTASTTAWPSCLARATRR